MKEETKKHKGKTPSFGNANSPLFLNNFQIDSEANIVAEQNTRESRKEEGKNERRTFSSKGSADLTDKFASPILSHRDTKKTVPKKSVTRPGQRPRPLSKKTSPYHNKSAAIGASTPKPNVSGIVSVINVEIERKYDTIYDQKSSSDTKSNPPAKSKPNRRQQSAGIKMNRTPTNKSKGKTSRNEYKESIPFEYNKDIITPNFDDKSPPSRPSREASPNLHFMSPTLNSKQRSSNQKNKKNKTKVDDFYTIEDLHGRALAQRELSKKSDLDKVDQEKEIASYMERISEQRQNAANLAKNKSDDSYIPSEDFISINANSMKASFKSNKSQDEYL
jgi:hypothetical protein